ncbi:MAG: PCC domain-containing protein [Streptosporangiaceae bacterium]
MHVIEVRDGELLAAIEQSAAARGIASAAIVTLIGAVDSFTLSTMPADDATRDVITDYELPAEMTATGEILDGRPHVHAVMAVEGDRAISGHLHKAQVGTWFARAYLLADTYGVGGTEREGTSMSEPEPTGAEAIEKFSRPPE